MCVLCNYEIVLNTIAIKHINNHDTVSCYNDWICSTVQQEKFAWFTSMHRYFILWLWFSFYQSLIVMQEVCNSTALKEFLAYEGDGRIAFVRSASDNLPRFDKVSIVIYLLLCCVQTWTHISMCEFYRFNPDLFSESQI